MTPQQEAEALSASLFRQLYLMRMLKDECSHFVKSPAPSGLKTALLRGARAYENVVRDLRIALPRSKEHLVEALAASDEKIYALNRILEILAPLPEEEVLRLESVFDEVTKQNQG